MTIGGVAAEAIGFGSAPGAQMITITPATGLTDGQVVHIVATGYVPGVQYISIECADKGLATAPGDCSNEVKIAVADASGTVTLDYTVTEGPFGANTIVYSAAQPCELGVAATATDGSSQAASQDISFA